MAGATVAKYLRLWGGTGVSVTLVERDSAYTSNILSNLVLNGQRTITSLQYGYSNLATRYGIRMVKGDVTAIDPVGHSVTLADGSKLPYDRLVIAPGVDFDIYRRPRNRRRRKPRCRTPGRPAPQTTAAAQHAGRHEAGRRLRHDHSGQALPLPAGSV